MLVVGLLRSHAEILRKLHELGAGLDPDAAPGVTSPVAAPVRRTGATGFDVSGTTPTDEAVRIGVVGARQSTVLAFLSSGCLTCGSFWDTFAASDRLAVPGGARLVVVTKGPEIESVSRIRELAPPKFPVVMSTEAWLEYKVPHTPYFVYVDGPSGRIVGEGSAQTWDQVVSLWSQALADAEGGRGPGRPRAAAGRHPPGPSQPVPEPGPVAGVCSWFVVVAGVCVATVAAVRSTWSP